MYQTLLKYLPQIIYTLVTILTAVLSRLLFFKLIRKYAALSANVKTRIEPILRATSITINALAIIIIITIWGVEKQNIWVALSSVFAIIGVALFAQWSILSNITAGLIIFFNSPFTIGDKIRILDKDFPTEAIIVNIKTFYTHLRTVDGVLHVYPNNLLLQKGISLIEDEYKMDRTDSED